jgi:hypothetical protein
MTSPPLLSKMMVLFMVRWCWRIFPVLCMVRYCPIPDLTERSVVQVVFFFTLSKVIPLVNYKSWEGGVG